MFQRDWTTLGQSQSFVEVHHNVGKIPDMVLVQMRDHVGEVKANDSLISEGKKYLMTKYTLFLLETFRTPIGLRVS